jgi:hypothetical protein
MERQLSQNRPEGLCPEIDDDESTLGDEATFPLLLIN